MFKKIFTVFLAFMFCVIPAFSSNVTALTIDGSSENFDAIINMNSSEHNGIYTFSVSVKLEDNRMVEGIHMQLNFNSEVFSVLSCNTMYSPDGEVQYKYNGNTGNIIFLYINMNRTYIVSDTVLFEAKFTKNSGNFNDSYPFALTISDFYYQNIIDTNYAVVNRIIDISDKSTVTGNIRLGSTLDTDMVCIESASKLKGSLVGVEIILLDISDSSTKNKSLWDIVKTDNMTETNLFIDFDYGMTGVFCRLG